MVFVILSIIFVILIMLGVFAYNKYKDNRERELIEGDLRNYRRYIAEYRPKIMSGKMTALDHTRRNIMLDFVKLHG